MIFEADEKRFPAVCALAAKLWPESGGASLAAELRALLGAGDTALFLCEEGGVPVGFAQVSLRRDYVEGTDSSPVGYLEGIYVEEGFRGQGLAAALLAGCEGWARQRGCAEFASDCALGNEESRAFHLRAGFAEAGRIICFTKKL